MRVIGPGTQGALTDIPTGPLRAAGPCVWELPTEYKPGMRVPGRVYANDALLRHILEDQALDQVANVAMLPGIVGASLAMPDIHWGYGFPIGGVAAMRVGDGVISPGGIGYDINCGVRLLSTNLEARDARRKLDNLADAIFAGVPVGTGDKSEIRLTGGELDGVMRGGARWAVERGYGFQEDLDRIEEGGCLGAAEVSSVSERAMQRGLRQVGTLGSGNHFLEVQEVEEVYEEELAKAFGLRARQVVIFVHTGSRGFGHQVCTDALHQMSAVTKRYGIELPDRQLSCAPIRSDEGRAYLAAMSCAANFAWANRQCITHWAREALRTVFGVRPEDVRLVYDVSHNIAKFETYAVDGEEQELCVHRKGATRAFPAGHPELSESVRTHGQPVLIPGDMGRYSYVAVGTDEALRQTFGSTCHGAGRLRSRGSARKELEGVDVRQRLESRGIAVRVQSPKLLAEEASEAYKDVADVIDSVECAGISRKVARMRPLAVIKG